MKTFHVKNFEKFQHYKDRSPPWIKLYNELLDDYEFGLLPDASKMHLVAIWLLASRSENKIPLDPAWISKRINATDKVNLQLLIDRGFIVVNQELQTSEQDASKPLASCLSREREEGETEKMLSGRSATRTKGSYSEEFEQFWKAYPRTPTMSKSEAWKAWMKLDASQRQSAVQAIEPYRRLLQSKPNLETVHACRFLSQERFAGLLEKNGAAGPINIRSSLV